MDKLRGLKADDQVFQDEANLKPVIENDPLLRTSIGSSRYAECLELISLRSCYDRDLL